MATQRLADLAHTLNPLRLSYTVFADRNPRMRGVQTLAALASASRHPVGADTPLLLAHLAKWLPPAVRTSEVLPASVSTLQARTGIATDHIA